MTEELTEPYVNLPRWDYFAIFNRAVFFRAIYISLPLVTFIYVSANVAYLAVLSPSAMLASDAIAVTFADRMFGVFAPIMPALIAICALGGLSVHIMTSSRLCFVGARNGSVSYYDTIILILRRTSWMKNMFFSATSLISSLWLPPSSWPHPQLWSSWGRSPWSTLQPLMFTGSRSTFSESSWSLNYRAGW